MIGEGENIMQREKVIYALRCRGNGSPSMCSECSYYNSELCSCNLIYIIKDALVLLQEQEARVLTLEETIALCGEPVWIEENTLQGSYGAWGVVKGLHERYEAVNIGGVRFTYWPRAKYNITWRCWSALPTEEQRKEASWEWQK